MEKPSRKMELEVTQSFEMTPASGPIGTPIELRVKGLGWRTMENTWVVNWDNRGVGFVTAAGTRRLGRGALSRRGSRRQSFRKNLHGMARAELSQLPAGAERVPAASRFHVPHDIRSILDACCLRGRIPAVFSAGGRNPRCEWKAERQSNPRAGRRRIHFARRRFSGQLDAGSLLADVRREPGRAATDSSRRKSRSRK